MASVSSSAEIVNRLRSTYRSGITRTLEWRIKQLRALKKLAFENQDEICK